MLALGRVLGLVVAGRFWCSYAWVSLTQTAPARPRGCLCVCVRLCACVQACVQACVRSSRRGVGVVYAVCRGVAVVWRAGWRGGCWRWVLVLASFCAVVCCCVIPLFVYLFSAGVPCAGVPVGAV